VPNLLSSQLSYLFLAVLGGGVAGTGATVGEGVGETNATVGLPELRDLDGAIVGNGTQFPHVSRQ
jgi:hypothetical protein